MKTLNILQNKVRFLIAFVVRRCGGDGGFTLIELIVSLACLSIIVLLGFFVYSVIHYILKFW
jgi:prepilin-type N-terminal cleavage/methylation domain-containing protein